MALVNTNSPPHITLATVDNNRRPGFVSMYAPTATTIALASGFLTLIRDDFLALTQNRLTGASVAFGFREDAPLLVIPPSSESERKLVLVFDVNNGQGAVTQEIPSPVFTIETDNTDEVNPADPLVAAYVDNIVNGAIGAENGVVNQYGIQITGLRRAYIRHVSSGRRR